MWTLTWADPPFDLPLAWDDIRTFGRRLRTMGFPDRLVVPELERDRWHVHMATVHDIPSDAVADAWPLGRVGLPNYQYCDDGGRGCERLAMYLSKGFGEPPSRRRYSPTASLSTTYVRFKAASLAEAICMASERLGRPVRKQSDGHGVGPHWADFGPYPRATSATTR